MGSGSAQVAGTVLALILAKYTNRTFAGIVTLLVAIVGVIMMLAIPAENYGARYGGYILMYQCKYSSAYEESCANQ
jgi:ACS family allantoate permease-like MFS transporter